MSFHDLFLLSSQDLPAYRRHCEEATCPELVEGSDVAIQSFFAVFLDHHASLVMTESWHSE